MSRFEEHGNELHGRAEPLSRSNCVIETDSDEFLVCFSRVGLRFGLRLKKKDTLVRSLTELCVKFLNSKALQLL